MGVCTLVDLEIGLDANIRSTAFWSSLMPLSLQLPRHSPAVIFCLCSIWRQRNHVVMKINDRVVTDCTDPQNRYLKGYLALQQHNAGSVVQYRNLMMRPLPVGQK